MDKEIKIQKNTKLISIFIIIFIITLSFLLMFALEIYSKLAIIIVCTVLFIEIFLLGWAIFCGYISRIKISKIGISFRKKYRFTLIKWNEFLDIMIKHLSGTDMLYKIVFYYNGGKINVYNQFSILEYIKEYCTNKDYIDKIKQVIKDDNYH